MDEQRPINIDKWREYVAAQHAWQNRQPLQPTSHSHNCLMSGNPGDVEQDLATQTSQEHHHACNFAGQRENSATTTKSSTENPGQMIFRVIRWLSSISVFQKVIDPI
jgi:hypothetical protein